MKNWIELEKKYLLPVYKRYPLVVKNAKGKYLWDIYGKKYIDFFSGISVCNLGHTNSLICKSIKKQIKKNLHLSNFYYSCEQIELASKLVQLYGEGKVFFSNSGAEANECAIKVVRKWGKQRYEIICFFNSFHGRTIATLSATGQEKFHKNFQPLVEGFKYANFNDINSVKNLLNNKTAAVMVEIVQAEGGVNIGERNFFVELESFCRQNNLLLIVDEIQTGLGRTGKMFAFQHFGIKPDIITLGKSLGGGLPLGATVVADKLNNVFDYGDHGSTFGGNPVSCAAAIAYLSQLDEQLLEKVRENGKYFLDSLKKLKEKHPQKIKDVRGLGLLLGMELYFKGDEVVDSCLKKGYLINCVQENVLRFLPPFIIEKEDIDGLIETLNIILEGR